MSKTLEAHVASGCTLREVESDLSSNKHDACGFDRASSENEPLSDDFHLEERTVEAVRRYRDALAAAADSEKAQARAHRALMSTLADLKWAVLEDRPLSKRKRLFGAGARAVTQSNEARQLFNKATATLEEARQALAALTQQLGYIPDVPAKGT
ncbi:hypothetical protein GPL21_40665 [Bradyrhizobium pachyrhizi]|uniref:Uncharacterized protein n=1 Tax=Bradyrhizobium pachyrhizi TaxID=280333 RepID=A0A844SWE5_9BRAD|nr:MULTISPECIES: hypothetical protein [Bradyrhizobium]MVT71313.1 hypothetical protein [Bradyrhizobium pachyrhizi]